MPDTKIQSRYKHCTFLLHEIEQECIDICQNGLNGQENNIDVLNPSDLRTIAKALKRNTGIISILNLSSNNNLCGTTNGTVDSSGVQALFEGITACSTLKELYINDTDIFIDITHTAPLFCQTLQPNMNPSLITINISNTNFNEQAAVLLGNVLSLDTMLLELYMNNNTTMNDMGGKAIAQGLAQNCTLSVLEISNCNLNESIVDVVAACCSTTSNITKLLCSNNNSTINEFSDQVGSIVIDSLENNLSSTLIWFNGISINDTNDTLSPSVSNTVDDAAAKVIWYLISIKRCQWKYLRLQNQLINNQGTLFLCRACESKNTCVELLDVRNNPVGLDLRQGTVERGQEDVALRRIAMLAEKIKNNFKLGCIKSPLSELCGVKLLVPLTPHHPSRKRTLSGSSSSNSVDSDLSSFGLEAWLDSILRAGTCVYKGNGISIYLFLRKH